MPAIEIESKGEYSMCVTRGYSPFFDPRFFVHYEARVEVLSELFPKYTRQNNMKFYRWYHRNHRSKCCEECGLPLPNYSAVYVSHIIRRNGHNHIAYDPMNCNLLCPKHHTQWEDPTLCKTMSIYAGNIKRIEWLFANYGK